MFETSPPYLGISVVMIMSGHVMAIYTHTHTPSTNKAFFFKDFCFGLWKMRGGGS